MRDDFQGQVSASFFERVFSTVTNSVASVKRQVQNVLSERINQNMMSMPPMKEVVYF